MSNQAGFAITGSRGFHITFQNGVTVSVQFGGGMHCDNLRVDIGTEMHLHVLECDNAEVAIFIRDDSKAPGGWLTQQYSKDENDVILGYQTPAEVLDILNWAAGYVAG